MNLVLDASVALAWLFERPDPQEAQRAEAALQALTEAAAIVPPLWHTEILNALLVAGRRGVVREAQVVDFLSRLDGLPIATDPVDPEQRREAVLALAREHGLTAYDATYLELALRTGAVLATFDVQLAGAVRRAGATLFGSTLPVEIYDPERKAEILLSNAVDAEDYRRAVAEVRAMGLDPAAIPHSRPGDA